MKLHPYQIWYNVKRENVIQVKVIPAINKAVALKIIKNLHSRNVDIVTLRTQWGEWLEFKNRNNN